MSAKKGLGRGFESLIPSGLLDESFDPTAGDDHKVSDLRNIHLDKITPDPDQPRQQFDEASLKELTDSIRVHGVLQPIVVTPKGDGYTIVAGERRFRASKAAGLETIPALVRTLSNQHKLELALIENLQRRDLNALETATAYAKLRDQFNLSLEQIGQNVGGKSVSAISNTLRLLRLPKPIQKALVDEKVTEGQARPLVDFDEKTALELLPKIISEHWSARRIEQFVSDYKKGARPKAIATIRQIDNNFQPYVKKLTQRFKAEIHIKANPKGVGQIVIPFKNAEDFERIEKLLEQ